MCVRSVRKCKTCNTEVGKPLENHPRDAWNRPFPWHCALCDMGLFENETSVSTEQVGVVRYPSADPEHYRRRNPQPIDVIAAWQLNYPLGCAVKYIARAGFKAQPGKTLAESAIEDLEKAVSYLQHEISRRKK